MLPAELLRSIKRLQVKARRLSSQAIGGEYLSVFRGQGQEFDQVRSYVPGDDVRSIDWNVTARMREPFVKVYREEREQHVMIVLDVSGSKDFATAAGRWKGQVAGELGAVLAYLALDHNDRVGLLAFSDQIEEFVPAQRGRAHVWHVVRTAVGTQAKGRGTDLALACGHLLKLLHRRTLVWIISDFMCQGYEKALAALARKHEVVAAIVQDPGEMQLPAVGLVRMQDAETGLCKTIDLSSNNAQESYRAWAQARMEQLKKELTKLRVDSFVVHTQAPSVAQDLGHYLNARDRGLRA